MRQMNRWSASKQVIGVIVAMALAGLPTAANAQFFAVGDLTGGPFASRVRALSCDGRIAVGDSSVSDSFFGAFRWTATGGITALALLPGGTSATAAGVSCTGRVIVGGASRSGATFVPSVWTGSLVAEIPSLVLGFSEATGVSSDGGTLVGSSGGRPWLVQNAEPPVDLGVASGADFAEANGVSSNGAKVIGNDFGGLTRAFVWSAAGRRALPAYGPTLSTDAAAISSDGLVIVGQATGPRGFEAVRWVNESGPRSMGTLPDGRLMLGAAGVSADGRVVVGRAFVGGRFVAAYWVRGVGAYNLRDLLAARGITVPNGWRLDEATCVSADGTTIGGFGQNPQGVQEGWVARLGPPCAADFSRDGSVDFFDYLDFIAAFAAEEERADTDDNGIVDFFDYLNFVAEFAGECG